MMMQSHRRLNQSLQKSFLDAVRFAPDVFPDLMRVVEFARIEVANAQLILLVAQGGHGFDSTSRWHSDFAGERLFCGGPWSSCARRTAGGGCPHIVHLTSMGAAVRFFAVVVSDLQLFGMSFGTRVFAAR